MGCIVFDSCSKWNLVGKGLLNYRLFFMNFSSVSKAAGVLKRLNLLYVTHMIRHIYFDKIKERNTLFEQIN